MALSYTEIEVEDETFHIFTLPDRRPYRWLLPARQVALPDDR